MKRSLYYVGILVFIFSEVKATPSGHRLKRAVYGATQNVSQNNDPNWYKNQPFPSINNKPQSNNPGGTYNQGSLNNQYNPVGGTQGSYNNLNNPTQTGLRPQDGHNTNPNWPNSRPPFNNTGSQWNNPGGNYYQGNLNNQNRSAYIGGSPQNLPYNNTIYSNPYNNQLTTQRPWNYPGSQGTSNNLNNPTQTSWRPQDVPGHTTNPNSYNTRPFNGTGSQWNNPGGQYNQGYLNNQNSTVYPNPYNNRATPQPQWNNPGGQGTIYNPNNPTNGIWRPQDVSRTNNSYVIKLPTWNGTGTQINNPNGQYNQGNLNYGSDQYLLGYKGNPNGNYNKSASIYPNLDWANPAYNYNATNNNFPYQRFKRTVSGGSQNLSWYNIDPDWYDSKPSALNGTDPEWNKPGGHFYHWNHTDQKNETHRSGHFSKTGFSRHHKIRHHHGLNLQPPNGPPPHSGHGGPHGFNPPPPRFHPCLCLANGTVVNGTSYPLMPANQVGSKGTMENGTSSSVPENNFGSKGSRHHNNRHHHGPDLSNPPPNRVPPHFSHGGPPRFNPPPPGFHPCPCLNNSIPAGSDTHPLVPENGNGPNGTEENNTSPSVSENVTEGANVDNENNWVPEIPDLNTAGSSEDSATPLPV